MLNSELERVNLEPEIDKLVGIRHLEVHVQNPWGPPIPPPPPPRRHSLMLGAWSPPCLSAYQSISPHSNFFFFSFVALTFFLTTVYNRKNEHRNVPSSRTIESEKDSNLLRDKFWSRLVLGF